MHLNFEEVEYEMDSDDRSTFSSRALEEQTEDSRLYLWGGSGINQIAGFDLLTPTNEKSLASFMVTLTFP